MADWSDGTFTAMGFPIATTLSAFSAAVSAVAAVGSWRSSKQANKAAERANASAEALARIENERRHGELTPVLEVEFTDQGNDTAMLKITLAGPAGLDGLDAFSVSVRDDGFGHDTTAHRSEAESAELARVIWGPYRFRHGVDGGSEDRRSVAPVRLAQGDWALFKMERTLSPSWVDYGNWRQKYNPQPARLTFTCVRDGYEPWTIPWEGVVEAG